MADGARTAFTFVVWLSCVALMCGRGAGCGRCRCSWCCGHARKCARQEKPISLTDVRVRGRIFVHLAVQLSHTRNTPKPPTYTEPLRRTELKMMKTALFATLVTAASAFSPALQGMMVCIRRESIASAFVDGMSLTAGTTGLPVS